MFVFCRLEPLPIFTSDKLCVSKMLLLNPGMLLIFDPLCCSSCFVPFAFPAFCYPVPTFSRGVDAIKLKMIFLFLKLLIFLVQNFYIFCLLLLVKFGFMDIYFCIWVCRTDENPKADSQTDGMKHKRAVYWGGCPEYKNTKNQNVKGRQKLTEPKVEINEDWDTQHCEQTFSPRDKGSLRQDIHRRVINGVQTAGEHSRNKLDITGQGKEKST